MYSTSRQYSVVRTVLYVHRLKTDLLLTVSCAERQFRQMGDLSFFTRSSPSHLLAKLVIHVFSTDQGE
jgi:hypothetical protein